MKQPAASVFLLILFAAPAFASSRPYVEKIPKVKHPQAVHPQNPYLKHQGHVSYKYKAPHVHHDKTTH